jgi:hypothetical protein
MQKHDGAAVCQFTVFEDKGAEGVMVEEAIIHVPVGAVKAADWNEHGSKPEWKRHQYRLSDDNADNMGHPYLVCYIADNLPNEFNTSLHFYRWNTLGPCILMLGDDQGNDYGFTSRKFLESSAHFFRKMQPVWCRKYHCCEHAPEREVPTNFNSVGDLVSSLVNRLKPNA